MDNIKVYDFKKTQKFTTDNIRFLTLLCEEFCKTSNLQLNYEFKNKSLIFNMNKTYQTNYGDFIDSTPYDSVIIEYNIEPLVENLTLKLDKKSALIIIDLILGGDGSIENYNRDLTEIDIEVLQYLIDRLLGRINLLDGSESIKIVDIYTNIAQYQSLNTSAAIFTSTIDISLEGEEIGCLNFCIPYSSMEPVLDQLISKKIINSNNNGTCDEFENDIFNYIQDINMDVVANLGSAQINISDLLKIEEGDIVLLNQNINDHIDINVGDSKAYTGRPGLVGVKKGVEITGSIEKER